MVVLVSFSLHGRLGGLVFERCFGARDLDFYWFASNFFPAGRVVYLFYSEATNFYSGLGSLKISFVPYGVDGFSYYGSDASYGCVFFRRDIRFLSFFGCGFFLRFIPRG